MRQEDSEPCQFEANKPRRTFLSEIPLINFDKEKLLDIGNKALDGIAFWKGKKRYAVDTLDNFLQNKPILTG